MRSLGLGLAGVASIAFGARVAHAQSAPAPAGPAGPGPLPTVPKSDTKDRSTGEAPTAPELLPTTPTLPPPKATSRHQKRLELDGYFRVRTEWDKEFWLGFNQNLAGGAPWPQPLSCGASPSLTNHPCDSSVGGVDMRLRLEPTIHLSEGSSIHIQADALDNVLFGSNPADLNLGGIYTGVANGTTGASNQPPLAAFGDNQQAIQGQNTLTPSLVIKRAWAEVALPFGVLKVGRQPNQWGMGVWKNAGGYDPITGTYDYQADYGDSVDRVSFTAPIPGTPLHAMIASDWSNVGLTSNMTPANVAYSEHPIPLDTSANVSTWVAMLAKTESPQDFKDAIDRGEAMLDYGVYAEYKSQGWAENLTGFTLGTNPNNPASIFNPATNYVPRHFRSYSASLWGKLAAGDFLLETELIGVLGTIDDLSDYGIAGKLDIRQFGGVGRATWSHFDNKLHVGVEGGFATGDKCSNTPQGNTNIAYANLIGPCTTELTQFIFNQEYKIDLIFWHQLVGAVTDAVYGRPFIAYDVTRSITAKLWNVTSAALKAAATPGHDTWYGTEFDADVMYHAGSISAGVSGGMLFPFSAEAHPASLGYAVGNQGDPQNAYTIMTRLILAF